jgi:vacuolar-type H+-ATPase subunit E/Vma4
MCEFVSWIEIDGTNYFLTSKELKTKKGKELKQYLGSKYYEDICGHGAIDWYFELHGEGTHKECADFSSPKNFPNDIVKTIKSGSFLGIGITRQILTGPAWAEYEKIRGTALAEYEKIRGTALAEYEKISGPAWAEYEKISGTALAEYEKISGPAWAEYEKIRGTAWAEYEKIRGTALAEYEKISGPALAEYEKISGPALAEYEKIRGTALAEYEKISGPAFWMIARDHKNRRKEWR